MNDKLFVYGILKRSYELDLEKRGCKFLGSAIISNSVLYRISTGVGLRFEDGCDVSGEVFEVPDKLWPWLDCIENNGITYTRVEKDLVFKQNTEPVKAWVYEHTYWPKKYYQEHLDVIEDGCF